MQWRTKKNAEGIDCSGAVCELLKADGINAVVTAGLGMKISYTSDFKHKLLPLYDH